MKNHARVTLKVNEPAGSTRGMSHASQSVDDALEDLKL